MGYSFRDFKIVMAMGYVLCEKIFESIKEYYDNIKFSSLYSNQSQKVKYHTQTIKYKLGMQSIDEDIQVLESIASNNKSIKFRLDANRYYTFEEFLKVYKKLKIFNIDYFEEPIQNPDLEKLKKIKNELDCKIAILDRSTYAV